MVLACTASLNVAVGAVATATFVAPDAGVSLLTAGVAAPAWYAPMSATDVRAVPEPPNVLGGTNCSVGRPGQPVADVQLEGMVPAMPIAFDPLTNW